MELQMCQDRHDFGPAMEDDIPPDPFAAIAGLHLGRMRMHAGTPQVCCLRACLRLSLALCRSYLGRSRLLERNFEEILLWIRSYGRCPEKVMAGLQLDLLLSIEVRIKHQPGVH